ncbi:inactive polyglycylase TTLL10 [Pelobates fuscus]|uniref:inactive polyglycylase TTLL10 n=1 Tax=Pelobates fuscus TaxID=191477 RepID=UPI002FE4ACF8
MQLKTSSVEHDQEDLQQGLRDTLKHVRGQMEREEDGREKKTMDKVSGTMANVSKEKNYPDESKSQEICLKTTPKPRKSRETTKSSSDFRSKTPSVANKNKKNKTRTKGVDAQVPRMSKAGCEPSNSDPLDEPRNEPSSPTQRISMETPGLAEKKMADPKGPGPFFYIGGNNGAQLVSAYCMRRGWQRIQDNKREDYRLKWCEAKCSATYCTFRDGEQLVYQIPNNKLLTTKIGLLNSLREYERVMIKISKLGNPRILRMEDFFPETFRMDIATERDTFFSLNEESQTWICKPTGLNQGRGIFLLKTPEQIKDLQCQLQAMDDDNKKTPHKGPQARIVQRYIPNPLLLDGRKFDVRSYLLIASTVPYFVFFCHGYVRLTCNHYDPKSDDLTGHLTNQYMQKKNPLYNELKEETVWSMERFNTYVNEIASDKGLPQDWVLNVFTKRMQQIMTHCFLAVKTKLDCHLGYFDLIGCDFLIDENFKVWLLEMNCNPALHTNCEVLKEVIPSIVDETLDLSLELFNKKLKSQRFLPLNTQSKFVLLYNGENNEQTVKFDWPTNTSFTKIQKELSPENFNKTIRSVEKPRLILKVPVKNRVSKIVIPKVTPRTTAMMASVQVVNIPSNNLPYKMKHKSKNEVTPSRSDALKHSGVPSESDQTKDIALQSAPVARFSFTNLQKLSYWKQNT